MIQQPVSKYARVYVRRWFPVLLPEEIEDAKSGLTREAHPSEKKYTKDDGPLDEKRLLSDIGVGDYTFRLNDSRRPWDQATIVHGEKLSTMRNWDIYPPVFDKNRLDWDDEANKVYIKWAQSRNHLPQDRDFEKEQADMAQANVVETVMNDARLERARADQLQKEAQDRAEKEAREAKEALAKTQAAKATEPVRPQSDLEAMGNVLVPLLNAIKPNPDNSLSEYLKLEKAREETRRAAEAAEREAAREAAKAERKRADDLQAEVIADLKKKAEAPPPAVIAPAAPPTRRQMLEDAVAEQQLLGQLAGRKGHSTAEEEEKPDNLEKYAALLTALAPMASQVIQGAFQTGQMLIQMWGTVSYNNALLKNGGEPKPPANMPIPEAGKPLAPQGPQLTPEQQSQQQQFQQILQQVARLIGPLQRALQNSKSGLQFAHMVIEFTEEGRADYDKIRNVAESLMRLGISVPGQPGIEQFKNAAAYLFQQFPQFWQKVSTLPTFGAFLEEFYNFDEFAAQEESR